LVFQLVRGAVMNVMAMEVFVSQWLMNVFVRMPLAEVQPYIDAHRPGRHREAAA